MNLFKKIADYIINEVRINASDLSGEANYCVEHADIQSIFSAEIKEFFDNAIIEELYRSGKVADATENTDGFDVILYKDECESNKSTFEAMAEENIMLRKILYDVSQYLQDNGHEEKSKAIDCEAEL